MRISFTQRFYTFLWLSCISVIFLSCHSESNKADALTEVPAGVLPVQIKKTAAGYELLRGGKPYFIKGVAGLQQLDRVKELGAILFASTQLIMPMLSWTRLMHKA